MIRSGPYLTDQYGQRYGPTGGLGIGAGPYPIFFQPLRGRALAHGGALTLHMPFSHAADGAPPTQRFQLAVALSGHLAPKPLRHLAVPPPVTDTGRGVAYAVLDLRYSGTYLALRSRFTGQLRNVITVTQSGAPGRVGPASS